MIALFLLCSAALPELKAPITRVVVFADRAEITRTGELVCEDGTAEASLPPIPSQSDSRSLRVVLGGDAKLTSLQSDFASGVVATNPYRASLEKERQDITAKVEATRDALRTLDEREATLDKLSAYFARAANEEMRSNRPPLEQWKKTLETLRLERQSTANKRLALQAEQRTEQRKLSRVDKKLSLFAAERQLRLVLLRAACSDQKKVAFTFSYVMPGASWRPQYDLRVPNEGGKAELDVSAIIQQSTGEDWKDVEVLLSTAEPALDAAAPVAAPIIVNGRMQEKRKVLIQQSERREAKLEAGNTQGAEAAGASIDDGGRVFSFKLKQKASIAADREPVWFRVDSLSLSTVIARVATPSLEPYVFRMVKQKNPAGYPLVAGTLNVFVGRTFVGEQPLKYIAPGEPFEVSLGLDETMRVERAPVRELDRAPKLLGSTKAWERQYRVRFQNLSDKPVSVELREAVPVSKSKDVTVEIDAKLTSAAFQHDKERGFLVWNVAVEREKAIDVAYVVRIPKDWETP